MNATSTLAEWMLITPEPVAQPGFDAFVARLQSSLERGIRLVQLRSKQLDVDAFELLAARVIPLCHDHGALVILNGPGFGARRIHADGVHLDSVRLMRTPKRMLPASQLLSAACHTRAQLAHAEALGVDFVTLSPVLPTPTHPNTPTLGWHRFAELLAGTHVPVYALGGMSHAHCRLARAFGAHGIAGISAFW